jgi:GNAT superfamily N-acetyltransferase
VRWLGGGDEEITEQENREWLDEKLRHWESHGFGLYAWFEVDGAGAPSGSALDPAPDSASDPPPSDSAPDSAPGFAPLGSASGSAPPGRFAGRAGIHRVDPDVGEVVGDPEAIELMYALAFDAWGHGFAGEIGRRLLEIARDDLGRAEIIADTVPHNVRSRRVMEALGFVCEREFWHDDHTMVLYRKTLGVATDGQAPTPGGRSSAP